MDDHQSTEVEKVPLFRVAFGIGCWDFGLRCDSPLQLTSSQYIDLLTKGLGAVSPLNNLEILPFHNEEIEINEAFLRENSEGRAVFSHGLLYRIKFDLYIPFRIQEELVRHMHTPPLKTENFRIHVHYPYHGPVSYVELIGDESILHPSSAMVIVREYMQSQLIQLSSDVVFTFVGPTPFHADFQVEGYAHYDSTDNTFGCEKTQSQK